VDNIKLALGISTGTSFLVSEAAQADSIKTALITFVVSIITLVGGEVIKLAVAWLQNKRKKLEGEDDGEPKQTEESNK